jgi:serine/threonine-protein kinase
MGVVYLAVRLASGTRVALKTIIPAANAAPPEVARFLREARILGRLRHPGIVAFEDMGAAGGTLYFAMEYVPGRDARRLLKESGPMPVGRAARLVCQLLEALEYAHARGFVHRDVKPANLLVTGEGEREAVKLADFGLARVYQESKLSGLTLAGDLGGTLPFMAPEQVTNFRDARPPADQYAAAATLYNLLTNHYLYDFPAAFEQGLLMILHEDPVPVQSRRLDLPGGLSAVIHRGLAREPADRFPDVGALRAALLDFCR